MLEECNLIIIGHGYTEQLKEGVQTVGRKTSWAKDVWANYFLGDKGLSSLHSCYAVGIVISLKLDVVSHDALDAVVLTRSSQRFSMAY